MPCSCNHKLFGDDREPSRVPSIHHMGPGPLQEVIIQNFRAKKGTLMEGETLLLLSRAICSLSLLARQRATSETPRSDWSSRAAAAPEPPLEDLLWTVAMARIILGPAANVQVLTALCKL